MDFTRQFRNARRVSTPIVAIRTFDAKSTVDLIRGSLDKDLAGTPMLHWDTMKGLQALSDPGAETLKHALSAEKMPQEATRLLPETLRIADRFANDTILFIANAHLHWAVGPHVEPSVIQAIWNLRDVFKSNGNMLVLLCSPGALLPPELASDVLVMDEPLPTVAELHASLRKLYSDAQVAAPEDTVVEKAVDALIGLPAFPAEQAAAMSLTKSPKVQGNTQRTGVLDIPELWERKRQIIGQTPGLSVWRGTETLDDIGGIPVVKYFCRRVLEGNDAPKTIIFMDEIEKAFAGTGTDMSGVKTELTGSMLSWMQDREIDGVIFIGVPGVSKSKLAKGLGGSYGRPVINFDLAGMQSALVGSSGANLRTAQRVVDAISGGRTLAIATCNSINALPPELRRRFNLGIFFFDAPDVDERAIIWDIFRTKYNIAADDPQPKDAGWTGAEIEECCKKAYRLRMNLKEAAQYIVPVTHSAADRIHELRSFCHGKFLSASKPGEYQYDAAHVEQAQTVATIVAVPGPAVSKGRKMREYDA